jgi:predicted ATPase
MPASLSTFVGREAELSELAAVLAETRMLTITGLGGAGKTRLALELAGRMGRHYGDGARIVELVSVRDERLVANRVLSVIGADPGSSTGAAAEEQLCQALAERQMLLVLDNCEHLLQATAALAAAVLRGCPDVTIVATSREVLSLPGEVAWAAPGLSLPPPDAATSEDLERSDAARLFCVRARAAHPGFEVTADNAPAVAAICRRLDGIPLALELAAARVRVLGVAGVAGRLEDRFRLLVGGPRSAPSRHQTLRAAMDWSFELLPEAEQGLLRRLSVFPQSFDLDAATAISGHLGTPLDVVDLLGRLIDTSLLVAEGASGTTRYRLLETVREYVGAKLAGAGEEAETQARHWRHFAERVRSAHRSGADLFGLDWTCHVATEAENYNAALAAALAGGDADSMTVLLAGLDYPWLFGNPVPTVVDSIEPAMLRCDDVSLHVEGLFGLALGGLLTGRWTSDAAVTIYEQALQLADRAGSPHDRSFARFYLGYMARNAGNTAAARAWMEEALDVFGEHSKAVAWHVHYELGWIDMIDGATAAALDHFRRGLEFAENWPGHNVQEVHLRAALGLAEAIEGHSTEGLALAGQAVEQARIVGLPAVAVMALVRAAEAAVVAGQPTEADLVELFRLLRHQGTRTWVAAALTVAALTQAARGDHARAAHLLGGAVGVAHVLGEDPHPIPAIAALVDTTRRRLIETLGSEVLDEHETAGRNSSLAELLRAAIDS